MPDQLNLLIIDDETAFTFLLVAVLEGDGKYKATSANSGEEAIELMKANKYDVILLDYNLGSMTGLHVLSWMNEAMITSPVIMLTGQGTEEVAVQTMKLGAYDYIRKERLELSHLPIMINGVHERYLFRKTKEEQEIRRREEEKQEAAMQMFQTTVRTIAHHVNNALAVIMLRSQSYERNLRKTNVDNGEGLLQLIVDLRGQAEIIKAVVASLVEISDLVYTRYASDQSMIDIHAQLEENLKKMQSQKIIDA